MFSQASFYWRSSFTLIVVQHRTPEQICSNVFKTNVFFVQIRSYNSSMIYETCTWTFIVNVSLYELYIKRFCQMFCETETRIAGFLKYALLCSAFDFVAFLKLMIAQWIFCYIQLLNAEKCVNFHWFTCVLSMSDACLTWLFGHCNRWVSNVKPRGLLRLVVLVLLFCYGFKMSKMYVFVPVLKPLLFHVEEFFC